jgi:hypothetical protein
LLPCFLSFHLSLQIGRLGFEKRQTFCFFLRQ